MELLHDFKNSFITGLKAKTGNINSTSTFDTKINDYISPLKLTSRKLNFIREFSFQGDGIYIGVEDNFIDIC